MKEKLVIKNERHICFFRNNYITYSLYNESGVKYASLDAEVELNSSKKRYIYEYKDKTVILISSFNTISEFRGKGYGKYLLNAVLKRLKGKCDAVHLDACPYYEREYKVTYRAYGNALNKKSLIKFYKSLGFVRYGKYKENGFNCYIMILNLCKM